MPFDAAAFGRRLAAARVWAGLEPKQLAASLGFSAETIYQLERGVRKRAPARLVIQALARELGQTEEWLVDGHTPPWLSAAASPPPDVLEQARLLAIRLADEMEALAELLAVDDEAATG